MSGRSAMRIELDLTDAEACELERAIELAREYPAHIYGRGKPANLYTPERLRDKVQRAVTNARIGPDALFKI
jgi:hypothetical protein